MFSTIAQHLKERIRQFPQSDRIIFNNRLIELNKENFEAIGKSSEPKTIAFIDGGQAEILSAGNFCLSFIRVGALMYADNKKIQETKHEFCLLVTAKYEKDDLIYEARIFPLHGEKIIKEEDLTFSSTDASIRAGVERASVSQITNVARRFAELALAAKMDTDITVIDGTLEPSYGNEEKYLARLSPNVCALAKSSSLCTVSGNSPLVLLDKIGLDGCWSYVVENNTFFVKLHEKSRHIFRYTGNTEFLPYLVKNSTDALFLGYPYGLIAADKFARISNEEKKSLRMSILLKSENKEILEYLSATNAHEILDNLG